MTTIEHLHKVDEQILESMRTMFSRRDEAILDQEKQISEYGETCGANMLAVPVAGAALVMGQQYRHQIGMIQMLLLDAHSAAMASLIQSIPPSLMKGIDRE